MTPIAIYQQQRMTAIPQATLTPIETQNVILQKKLAEKTERPIYMPEMTERPKEKAIGIDIQGMSITPKLISTQNQSYGIVDRKPKLAKNVCKQN